MKTSRSLSLFRGWHTCRAAFTLTELVVVLATVSVLVVICLPALAGTKGQSRIGQCASNLQQFTLAMHIYGGENNDKLPPISGGNWVWDLPWYTGNIVTQWVSWRQLYCPGTSVRFTDQDNLSLWNWNPNGFHVINYALTFTAGALNTTNQNSTLTPRRISFGATVMPAPSPSQRVLLADATISDPYQNSNLNVFRSTYNYTYIQGGYAKAHVSPHLNGKMPAGGNLGMLDGHIEWRTFDSMQSRTDPNSGTPTFWW